MQYQGVCHKMHTALAPLPSDVDAPTPAQVQYQFVLDQEAVNAPFVLGQEIELEWTGNIYCVSCGNKTPNPMPKAIALSVLKPKPPATCAS